ncbi:unnamed protein product [Ambrosiozyma monospora]|uniref:Unnamed protein product n=1 Tax=Ambrosiozyma monospora TaxID=43982 RepID=A0ACB5TX41_AMBMO|nr:unnamed protein product [Ambrosiozyma monospora]
MPGNGELKGTCYKSGIIVNKFHQQCEVTNEKIVSMLNGKKAEVTFSCNKTEASCNFQFWIAQQESFFCELNKCDYQYDLQANTTHYKCPDVACKCLPDKMLCGQRGSIDISDFLTETIKGPGDFTCDLEDKNCKFSEPSMNDLIQNVFGDPYITLNCQSGECLHESEIPGFDLPDKPKFGVGDFARIGLTIVAVGLVVAAMGYAIKRSPLFNDDDDSKIALSDDSSGSSDGGNGGSFMEDYQPATFSFENVTYKINGRTVLNNAAGLIQPGECLAIMGGSGAGKTTLLDIIAGKNKSGESSGSLYVNGELISTKQELYNFQQACGFVDQEDVLIPTLTVYETVLNSALSLDQIMNVVYQEVKREEWPLHKNWLHHHLYYF